MTELKPCDYCESADVAVVKEWRGFYVLCQDCCCRGPYSTNAEQAAELWNTRATDAELERLREDVSFLLTRAHQAGSFSCDKNRSWGLSSNSLVAVAYGSGNKLVFPSDESDFRACQRAFNNLPDHRKTDEVKNALKAQRAAIDEARKG